MSTETDMIETLKTGDLIRHGRMSLGMTQSELAQYLTKRSQVFRGVDTVTISRWEAGRVYPSTRRLIAFAKILYPQHARPTLRHMVSDRPRGSIECPIDKINTFAPHPYLIGEAQRALVVSKETSRLTTGSQRCIDPYFEKLGSQEPGDRLALNVLDPSTQEIFGHILATLNAKDYDKPTLVITSIYAGSDRIFEYLLGQFFRFAVQKDAVNISLLASNTQDRSLAKRMGMIQTRAALPSAIIDIARERQAESYVGDYYETLAHPDFVGLFASDTAPYPEAAQESVASEELSTKRVG